MPQDSASFFAQVSRDLMDQERPRPTLDTVVDQAVEVIEPCDAATITLRRRAGRLDTVASTSEIARECDQLQYTLGEGACVDAVRTELPFVSPDLAEDLRWPRWGPKVVAMGLRSILSIQLASSGGVLGSLNLYAGQRDAYGPDDVDTALVFGVHAANAMASSETIADLKTAMNSRHSIGVAQGILMVEYGLDQDRSFELLRRYSSHLNVKLRYVAAFVVAHRRLPDERDVPAEGSAEESS